MERGQQDILLKAKKRIPYIDLAKGILIVFLILGHTVNAIRKSGVETNEVLNGIHVFRLYLWTSFYMSAFFIITGYCSNFKKDFVTFFISNFKTIKVPAVIFGFLSLFLRSFSKPVLLNDSYVQTFFYCFVDSGLWFLDALFISKIIYWVVAKYGANKYVVGAICLLFLSAGVILLEQRIHNYGYFIHAFLMLPFLYIGQLLKGVAFRPKLTVGALISFAVIILIFVFLGMKPPYVTLKINLPSILVPSWIILSVSGTIALIGVCKQISYNRLLCFIGRNSLVYYCMHLIVLGGLKITFQHAFGNSNYLLTCLFYVTDVLIVVVLCGLFAKILNTKYLRFCLGKF